MFTDYRGIKQSAQSSCGIEVREEMSLRMEGNASKRKGPGQNGACSGDALAVISIL